MSKPLIDQTDKQNAPVTGHQYDGIEEYDNPLPGWWVWLFVASIIFAPLYWMYFETGVQGRWIQDSYDRSADKIFTLRFAEIGVLTADRETILKYSNDPEWTTVGRVMFKSNCVSCHGQNAQGGIGPNLTDDYWKNVNNVEDIAKVIENGAANGAMPAWKNRMSHPNQIVLTAAYIASLRGSDPANAKIAEGNPIPPWPKPDSNEEPANP